MSSEYSVFMKGDARVLLRVAEQVLGHPFDAPDATSEGARHAELFEVAITFQDAHGLESDMGIPFEEFPVSLEFARGASQGEPETRELLCRTLSVLFAQLVAGRGHADAMVVRDLQSKIGTWAKES